MRKLKLNKTTFFLGLKRLIIILAVIYPIAIFFGYMNFANALLTNSLQTLIILAVLVTLHLAFKDFVTWLFMSLSERSADEIKDSFEVYWITVLFDVIIFVGAIILMFLIWGAYPQTVYDGIDVVAFKGVKVGQTSFSVVYVLKAVFIYFIVYYISRLILRLVENKVFPYTHFDQGTQQAISTVIGYAGLFLAIIMAIYSLGISSTSLAFIISAFTFGLSFGLKEIFNNFISGVILLIERPIKVGDWVDVAGESGVIKSIRLRATVVETFSRKTLLIPNSQFITSVVSNDLYNPISRCVVVIECSYDDDPKTVKELLLVIAKNHEGVLTDPAPSVVFTNFNASGLEFNLRFFCATQNAGTITSEIRYRIFEEFKANNIEIPYPKNDIYIKENVPVAEPKSE